MWYTNSLTVGKGTQVGPRHRSPSYLYAYLQATSYVQTTSSSPFLGVAVALSAYRLTYLPVASPVYFVVAVPTRMRVSHLRAFLAR